MIYTHTSASLLVSYWARLTVLGSFQFDYTAGQLTGGNEARTHFNQARTALSLLARYCWLTRLSSCSLFTEHLYCSSTRNLRPITTGGSSSALGSDGANFDVHWSIYVDARSCVLQCFLPRSVPSLPSSFFYIFLQEWNCCADKSELNGGKTAMLRAVHLCDKKNDTALMLLTLRSAGHSLWRCIPSSKGDKLLLMLSQ